MELPIYDIVLPDDSEAEMTFMSLVGSPASELEYLKFNKTQPYTFSETPEKRVVTGVAISVGKLMYRDKPHPCYVRFTEDSAQKYIKKAARTGKLGKVNLDHATTVEGVHLFENYFVNRDRGIMPPKEFEAEKDGSLITSYLVENDKVWDDVKAGKFNGFSPEGLWGLQASGYEAEAFALVNELEQILTEV